MQSIAYVVPLLPGRTDEARLMCSESMGKRRDEYARANRDKGISREFRWIQKGPEGDMLLTYMEVEDSDEAYRLFVEAKGDFDKWYKEQLEYVSGLDFDEPGGEPIITLFEIQGEAVAHAVPMGMVMPVAEGKVEALKAWFEELKGPRRDELRNYLERGGLAREAWYLQSFPGMNLLITYALIEDPAEYLKGYAYSDHPFDVWVKAKIHEFTGFDMNAPKEGPLPKTAMPELVLDWHHAFEAAA